MSNAFELDSESDDPLTLHVNVAEAKARLSELLDRALNGQHIVICKNRKPLVELNPVEPRPKRQLGQFKFLTPPPDDFFDPLSDEELAWWEGEHDDPELAP
jgi:prevent-host-death family protein